MASSKLRASGSVQDDDCKMDMSPMIDMVFLLLLFFLVNATAIIVKQDPNVRPPIANNSKIAKDGNGRIVVNIREDGTFTNEEGKLLETDADIVDLVRTEREKIVGIGWIPKLHLRGDKEAVFKHCRRVMKNAAEAGVDQVIFAVYVTDK